MPAGTLIAILLLSTPTAVAAKKPHVTSVYTKAYKNCKVIEEQRDPEGVEMWSVSRCRGYAGIPLFLSTDDSRDFLTAGPKFEGSGIDGPLHTIAGPVEWRLVDGKPFAIIFRVTTAPENGPWSRLIVETVGRPGKPGCSIAKSMR